ncbi:MAG: DUF2461 domain-containing protein [Chloroflexi bacterium]|nr:DUF2461 domain-containing protein [Chloroflexota bacterium]MCY3589577.1 DUF2461 domain-containing protein [Chloroflexota bacterium]MCY3685865.1 DUF2461 domain-containing protein [Chloroflexota bacterium]MDE2709633.1 DUF2461 domain-containing protein [Chloroflexota bacterium]
MVFSEELIDFLVGLSANNEREWFNARKDVYETVLREPALEYIRQVGGPLADISPHIRASDRKQGGSLMRIYRDVRFSRDKSPYKTNVGIQFRHESGKDVHAPGYYVHISIEECFIGAGSWMPDRDALLAYRRAVSEHPREWTALKELAETSEWSIDGHHDMLKRPPRGFSADDPMIEDIKRKHFIVTHRMEIEDVTAPDFVDYTIERFKESREWMAFLAKAIGLPF